MDRAYKQVFASLKKARKELKAKDEQLMAQESELSALRAKVAELMTQQAARDGVNLASVDNSLYPSSTTDKVESEQLACVPVMRFSVKVFAMKRSATNRHK